MTSKVNSGSLYREILVRDRATRYRPHLPFTEPSCEVDVSCGVCFHGEGCRSATRAG